MFQRAKMFYKNKSNVSLRTKTYFIVKLIALSYVSIQIYLITMWKRLQKVVFSFSQHPFDHAFIRISIILYFLHATVLNIKSKKQYIHMIAVFVFRILCNIIQCYFYYCSYFLHHMYLMTIFFYGSVSKHIHSELFLDFILFLCIDWWV